MFGQTLNQLVLPLFLYIFVPAIIIGLLIGLGPFLIKNLLIFLGNLIVFLFKFVTNLIISLFNLIKKIFHLIFKKSSPEFPEFYVPTKSTYYHEIKPYSVVENKMDKKIFELESKIAEKKGELEEKKWELKEKGEEVETITTPNIVPEVGLNKMDNIVPEIPKISIEPLTLGHIHDDLSPKYFEIFTGIILGKMGFRDIQVIGKSHDKGIDVEVHKDNQLYIVQCKRYEEAAKIRAKEIRELYGNIVHKNARGYIITTGAFTKDAIKQVKEYPENSIELVDGEELLKICKQMGIKTNKQLLEEILKTFA